MSNNRTTFVSADDPLYIVVRPGGLVSYKSLDEAVTRAKVFSHTRRADVYAITLVKSLEPTVPGPPLRFG